LPYFFSHILCFFTIPEPGALRLFALCGISDAAESIGFRTRGYRLRWEQLRDEVPLSWRGAGGKEQGARGWAKGKEQSAITDQLLEKNVV
jgi:hypothetical protein